MNGMPIPTLIAFAIYLLGMILIGVYVYRQTNTLGDFILG